MAFLLELKESFKKFYNRYNTYIVPASKFIIALICFIMINTSIGYMDKLKNPVFCDRNILHPPGRWLLHMPLYQT